MNALASDFAKAVREYRTENPNADEGWGFGNSLYVFYTITVLERGGFYEEDFLLLLGTFQSPHFPTYKLYKEYYPRFVQEFKDRVEGLCTYKDYDKDKVTFVEYTGGSLLYSLGEWKNHPHQHLFKEKENE